MGELGQYPSEPVAKFKPLYNKEKPTKGASVEFNIKTDEGFEKLLENEPGLRAQISEKIWFNQKSVGGQVVIQTDKSISDENSWSEVFDFYIEYYNKFKEVIPKYIN